MDLRRLITLNLLLLGVLSSWLVGLGEGNGWLPLGTLVAALLGWWHCEVSGRAGLGPWVVNAVILFSAALAVSRFAQVGSAPDAVIAAHALTFLMIALFFEQKTPRTWWDLFSLSLLLVFLSTALHHGPLFAPLLVASLFFVLTALALLALHRQQRFCELAEEQDAGGEYRGERVDGWRLAAVGAATLVVGPLSLYFRSWSSRKAEPEGSSAVLPGSNGQVPRTPPASRAAAGWFAGIGAEFWWRMGRITGYSLLIGAVIFVMTPRFGEVQLFRVRRSGSWQGSTSPLQRTVGFDDQVQLGQFGSVSDDHQQVLRIRFWDHRNDTPYRAQGNLFLRGAVLNHYADGRWEHRPGSSPLPLSDDPRAWGDDGELVRQEVLLEPLDRPELFCVWPFHRLAQDDRVQYDGWRERLQRPGSLARRAFAYELLTTGFLAGRQAEVSPASGPTELAPLLQFPVESLPETAALAARWLADAGLPADEAWNRAQALERRLRASPRFEYRLGNLHRDPSRDPIETFIAHDSRGHCEYFASALTLMLRSAGLPARMVVGYKTDEYNNLEQCYWARQSDAHTWVEVFLPEEAIPAELRQQQPLADWSHGGWLRLDPTPSDLNELSWGEYARQQLRLWQVRLHTMWNQHVLQMGMARQDVLIYRPLIQGLRAAFTNLTQGEWWLRTLARFGHDLRSVLQAMAHPPLWFASGLLLCGLVISLVTLRRRSHAPGRWEAPQRRLPAWPAPTLRNVPAFFHRWQLLIRRWGFQRAPNQTVRELAAEAGERIAAANARPQLRQASLQVAEAFYQVRFGSGELDARQAAQVEQALDDLRLAQRPSRGSRE